MWPVSAIIEFNEQNEFLKIAGYMELTWTDEFLTWDPTLYGGLDEVFIVRVYRWMFILKTKGIMMILF